MNLFVWIFLGILLLYLIYCRFYTTLNSYQKLLYTTAILFTIFFMIFIYWIHKWSLITPDYILTKEQKEYFQNRKERFENQEKEDPLLLSNQPIQTPTVENLVDAGILYDPNQKNVWSDSKKQRKQQPIVTETTRLAMVKETDGDVQVLKDLKPDTSRVVLDQNITPKTVVHRSPSEKTEKPVNVYIQIINGQDQNPKKGSPSVKSENDSKCWYQGNRTSALWSGGNQQVFDTVISYPKDGKTEGGSSLREKEEKKKPPQTWNEKDLASELYGVGKPTEQGFYRDNQPFKVPYQPTKVGLYATQPSKKWDDMHQFYDWLDSDFPQEYSNQKVKIAYPPIPEKKDPGYCPTVLPTSNISTVMDYNFLASDSK